MRLTDLAAGKNTAWRLLRRMKGFTILELMIAVAIVAILATMAYPMYQSSVLRSKRAIVKVRLMDIVELETKYYIDNRTYGDLSDLGFAADTIGINDDGYVTAGTGTYDLSVTAASATTFKVQAVAKTPMLNDSGCLTMTVDLAGSKTPLACW